VRFTVLTAIGIPIMTIITIAITLIAVTTPIIITVVRLIITATGMGSDDQFQYVGRAKPVLLREPFPYAIERPPNSEEAKEITGRQSFSEGTSRSLEEPVERCTNFHYYLFV
jgi:hypothetical protein